MSYQSNRELPESVRDRLSETAQHFYRVAFNSALQWYCLECGEKPSGEFK